MARHVSTQGSAQAAWPTHAGSAGSTSCQHSGHHHTFYLTFAVFMHMYAASARLSQGADAYSWDGPGPDAYGGPAGVNLGHQV